jgi:aspartyl-tRNA(Asn)/glutamyl-tRNA(Gln) amidotransferase subunit B
MQYETVIGLEVHSQLLTKSKMFCDTSAAYADAPPNTHVCPVCLGMPGCLPVINRQAVEYTIMTGLALNSTIPEYSKFDRKNYPYPDLVKGYQISQFDAPLCVGGYLTITLDGKEKQVGLTRIHLEEDTAKLLHRSDPTGETFSLVDVNRSGVPLMEIVSEPDMRTPEEARQYLIKLRTILRFLGVSTGNMEEGSFRCDANVSIRPVGASELGAKVEVKNMNSFMSVLRALEYEVKRQTEMAERGERIAQETRGWNEDRRVTVGQRSKEHAHDYRYFPEPDLPPLTISREWVSQIELTLPELPDAKRARYASELGLTPYQAAILAEDKARAAYFEEALGGAKNPARASTLANWVVNVVLANLNETGGSIDDLKVRPAQLAGLLDLIDNKTISDKIARGVFQTIAESGRDAAEIVSTSGLAQISDDNALGKAIDEAIASNPQALADYKAGKKAAMGFFVGQIMKLTKGQADPSVANKLLREKLDALA